MMKHILAVTTSACVMFAILAGAGEAPKAAAVQDAGAEHANSNAPNVSGAWKLSWTAKKGKQRQAALPVTQSGSHLSGTFQEERGSAPLSGTLRGNHVSFSIKGERREASFTGTVDKDRMRGTTNQGRSWTATRQ